MSDGLLQNTTSLAGRLFISPGTKAARSQVLIYKKCKIVSKPELTAIFKLHAAVFTEIQACLFTVVFADMPLKKLLQREALEAVWAWIGTLSLMLGPYVKPQVFRGVEVLGAGLTLTFSVLPMGRYG